MACEIFPQSNPDGTEVYVRSFCPVFLLCYPGSLAAKPPPPAGRYIKKKNLPFITRQISAAFILPFDHLLSMQKLTELNISCKLAADY